MKCPYCHSGNGIIAIINAYHTGIGIKCQDCGGEYVTTYKELKRGNSKKVHGIKLITEPKEE